MEIFSQDFKLVIDDRKVYLLDKTRKPVMGEYYLSLIHDESYMEVFKFEEEDQLDENWEYMHREYQETDYPIVATTEREYGLPLIDLEEIPIRQRRAYNFSDLRSAFEAGRKRVNHPDWDYIYDEFVDFFKQRYATVEAVKIQCYYNEEGHIRAVQSSSHDRKIVINKLIYKNFND